jgi:hypothetical protein
MKQFFALLIALSLSSSAFAYSVYTTYSYGIGELKDVAGVVKRKYKILVKAEHNARGVTNTVVRYDDDMRGFMTKEIIEKLDGVHQGKARMRSLSDHQNKIAQLVTLKGDATTFKGFSGRIKQGNGNEVDLDLDIQKGRSVTNGTFYNAMGTVTGKISVNVVEIPKAQYDQLVSKVSLQTPNKK